MKLRRLLVLLLPLVLPAAIAGADPINIFNTGVNGLGVVLPAGSVDGHWKIDASTGVFPGPDAFVPGDTAFPFPPWIANDLVSKWIVPDLDDLGGANEEYGYGALYTYRTTFDLDGLVASTASLSGRWASDNQTVHILLNGVDTGIAPNCADSTSDVTCFTAFTSFSITTGFFDGINTLDFVVLNGKMDPAAGGPSGLRVEIAGAADAVPEPGSLFLLGSGLLALAAWRRRA